jgi:hypothetical protein
MVFEVKSVLSFQANGEVMDNFASHGFNAALKKPYRIDAPTDLLKQVLG